MLTGTSKDHAATAPISSYSAPASGVSSASSNKETLTVVTVLRESLRSNTDISDTLQHDTLPLLEDDEQFLLELAELRRRSIGGCAWHIESWGKSGIDVVVSNPGSSRLCCFIVPMRIFGLIAQVQVLNGDRD
ncbi:hypothetical protein IMZ48_23520, partial [Candidatus Bathyarchaeota archaeon]|nr:hypothetical protein [Candidatus Bathyarchaeota archaeon]